tara:strand:+ start:200 stop:1471 length:1272 start_codon:yes stop_codon:yes gene_type:complete
MIKRQDLINIYFLPLFFIPVAIILGPSVSLILTILIGLIYLIKFFNLNDFNYFKSNKAFLLLLFLYSYLIFNTVISLEPTNSVFRNLGFLRFIFLFVAINFFFYACKYDNLIFRFWSVIFLIFVTDVYIERFTGSNLLGYGALDERHGPRVVSFFKDEPIAGAYINGFLFLITGYFFSILENKKKFTKILIFFLFLVFVMSIILTGERSNTIKVIFGFILFVFFLDYIKLKTKFLILSVLFFSFIIALAQSDYLKKRYFGKVYDAVNDQIQLDVLRDETKEIVRNHRYFKLYKSGFSVFKRNPIFGVGNKNYRIETCDENKHNKFDYYCLTHPHQVYFEFLSEHGILGTLICLSILFYLMFRNIGVILLSKNYIQIGAFIYLIMNFLPLIPSGSFFSDFNITLFMVNFSLMYAVNNKTNIFEK